MEKIGKKTIAAFVLFTVIIIAALIINFSRQPATDAPQAKKYEIPAGSNFYFGTTSPRITIVEFSDFACPYCQGAYGAIRKLGLKYQKEVKIIFRDFPMHAESLDLAMAARCAGEQGLFWPMHDRLFSLQGQFATTSLPDLAVSVGVNVYTFKICLENNKYLEDIQADYSTGIAAEVAGTPTFFINGYKIAGALSEEQLEEIIKEFLK